ncbi:hypothetical protein [Anabaena sp. UHCC 0399]|uniref:hypothetical protein n=1 Tax=Anabaena sp. UHCC 0399 TaxID=3110238 RepID=UPI002B219486|nr:hypothetical protein [Anabaena sp. UHCC 0399]MEA5567608.1 hypothetical protein [Anabaena sp. UHCC 0399]
MLYQLKTLIPLVSEELFNQQLESGWEACQGTDVIIYTPLTNWAYHMADTNIYKSATKLLN